MSVCDRCKQVIRGSEHVTSIGTHCSDCFRPAWAEFRAAKESKRKPDGRGAAAKARWAAMSEEERTAHVAKMQAGRGR